MKMINTYSLGAFATIFSSTQALTGNNLITLGDGMSTGIIWNSDKSLCLKLSGHVFNDELSDSPANPRDGKKHKKWNTCHGVSASFSHDCVNMINDGWGEDDLPEQYRFRISEHPDRGDRFCIINDCDDGLNPTSSVYKLQWNGKKLTSKKGKFELKPFGGDSLNVLSEYFWFDGSVFKYGNLPDDYATTESYGDDNFNQVVWKASEKNVWGMKKDNRVDKYDFSLPQASCAAAEPEPIDPIYFLSDLNRGLAFTETSAVQGQYDIAGITLDIPFSAHQAYGQLERIEDDVPANGVSTTTFQYKRDGTNTGWKWFGFRDAKYKNNNMKVSFNYKWIDIDDVHKQNGHLGHLRRAECGLKLFGQIQNGWFENPDCFDSWCTFEEEYFPDWAGEDLIILIFDSCGIDMKIRVNDFEVDFTE